MTQRNDGGPAFPVPGLSQLPNDQFLHPHHGMSLRDAFAVSVLPAIYVEFWRCAAAGEYSVTPGWRDGVAADAYQMADAMLAARERT